MRSDSRLSRRGLFALRAGKVSGSIRPPWTDDTAIASACTGCGACVSACPQTIIRLDGKRLPTVDFHAGECTFCGGCAEACHEAVFDRSMIHPFRHRACIGNACFAANGIVCQTCGDRCPEGAISFRLRRGGPATPSIDHERCTGCGACIAACPTGAIGSIPLAAE